MEQYFRITQNTQRFLQVKAIDLHYIQVRIANNKGIANFLADLSKEPFMLTDPAKVFARVEGRYTKITMTEETIRNFMQIAMAVDIPAEEPVDTIGMVLNSLANGGIAPTNGYPVPYIHTQSEYHRQEPIKGLRPASMKAVRLSERAAAHFQQQAAISAFAPDDHKWRRREIGKYVAALSNSAFADHRPSEIKATDETLLKLGRKPIWNDESERSSLRLIDMDDLTIQSLKEIGDLFGIKSLGKRTALAVAANVLEAIGIGWLVPFAQPSKQRTA